MVSQILICLTLGLVFVEWTDLNILNDLNGLLNGLNGLSPVWILMCVFKFSVCDGVIYRSDDVCSFHVPPGIFWLYIRSGGLHTWARRKYVERVDGYSDTTNSSQSFSASPISSVKPNRTYTIDNAFSSRKSNQLNQTIKHLRTALYIAEYERPLSDFGKLIHLQRENESKMLSGKDSDKTCATLLDSIEKALEECIKDIINNVEYYSILFDGSDATKLLWL